MDLFSDNFPENVVWPSLSSQFQSPTYEFAWFSACANAFHGQDNRSLITIEEDKVLLAIAPLSLFRRKGITWQEIMGVRKLNEPGGLVYTNKESLSKLCRLIVNKGLPTQLGRLPADDISIQSFEKLSSNRGFLFKVNNTGSPYIERDSSWEEYFDKLSSRRRQDYRRARRRLSDHGEVSVEFTYPTSQNLGPLLEETFHVEQANWKGKNQSAINCRPELKQFFSQYCHSLCDKQQLLISSLRLNNKMVAVQIIVEHAERWWILKIGYNDRWSKYSPGMQLMFDTIKETFKRKLDAIELLGTEEQWINIWPHKTHQFVTLVYFPFNLTGITALCLEASSKLVSRLRKYHSL
jgi:CelD/BcsL family acetyltransferase involved in cellulose biosynthesis